MTITPSDSNGASAGAQSRWLRLTVCLAIGLALGIAQYVLPEAPTDWDEIHLASRVWLSGADPYAAMQSAYEAHVFQYPLVYPGSALVAAIPFAILPLPLALALWTGLGGAALAWVLTRREWWGLLGLLNTVAWHAFIMVQWSPLLTGLIAFPWLAFLWVAKPTLGLVLFLARPSFAAALGGALLLILSLLLVPHWPAAMLQSAQAVPHIVPLAMRPGGALLLLGWLRWRRPEGRLLGAMACVPLTPMLYEMVPLLLIPRGFRQIALVTLLGLIAFHTATYHVPFVHKLELDWPWLLGLLYLPCLYMVLRRPNVAERW
jgi:hypothetical protein